MADASDNVPPVPDGWSELDDALAETEREFVENGSPELTEREMTDAAEAAKREYRRERLALIESDMRNHPELVTPLTVADVAGAEALVEGVVADPNEDLGDDFVMP